MAEAPSLYAESLEKLDQELTCPICRKHFEEPKVLQCCHYYCRECIVQMRARTRGKDYFQCPECRMEIRLPGDDPESLPTAFFVNRMKEVFSTMQKAQGKVELTCESCHRTTTPVEAFCRHCALFICQRCEEAHRTMRGFSDHVVVPLDDLRQNTAAHLPVKEEAQIRCKEHGGKKMKLYCYDCKQLICRDCIVIDHKGHEYNFVNKAAVQCRASLKESVAPLRETQVNVCQVLKEVESMKSKLDANSTTVAGDIDRSIDKLVSLLQEHKKQLHREAKQLVESKRKALLAQKKNIQLATAEIESLLDFVDHKSQQASDQEVLGLQKQITDRAEEVVQKYGNPKKQFGPTDVPCLKVQFSADIGRKVKQAISISEKTSVKGQLVTVIPKGNPEPEKNLLPGTPRVLTVNDLSALNTHLRCAAQKWQTLGLQLGFKAETLATLPNTTIEGRYDPAIYLSKVLFAWLQKANPPATLEALCTALSHEAVGEEKLAQLLYAVTARPVQTASTEESKHTGQVDVKSEGNLRPEQNVPPQPIEGPLLNVTSEGNPEPEKNTLPEKDCPICLDSFKNPTRTKCGHQFCSGCLRKAMQFEPYCPTCKSVLRAIVGKQPWGGQMTHMVLYGSLPGYEGYSTIQINYTIPNGVQGQEHPNPGQPFLGTSRIAYLPDTYEGREVLELLRKAFNARLIFTVGTSVTSGAQNVVVWNDIHHKTNMRGGAQVYGYPDPTYLQRVKDDLAAKGIVPDSARV